MFDDPALDWTICLVFPCVVGAGFDPLAVGVGLGLSPSEGLVSELGRFWVLLTID